MGKSINIHGFDQLSCQLPVPAKDAKGQGDQIRQVDIQSLIEAMSQEQSLQFGQVHQRMVEVESKA